LKIASGRYNYVILLKIMIEGKTDGLPGQGRALTIIGKYGGYGIVAVPIFNIN